MSNQTIQQWLQANTTKLRSAGIDSARLDCLLLLEHELGTDRASLLAHGSSLLTEENVQRLDTYVARRVNHEPIAYIRGYSAFYGRQFFVSPTVLVPRPESETILELLTQFPTPSTIIDVGTGSGALAISAKLLHPQADVYAIDIDPACLEVARKNASQHHADVTFIESNLLADIDPTNINDTSVILANLPYVPLGYPVNLAAKQEPDLALYGGADGLELYKTLWLQLDAVSASPMAVICESLEHQHAAMVNLALQHEYQCVRTEGLQQLLKPTKS